MTTLFPIAAVGALWLGLRLYERWVRAYATACERRAIARRHYPVLVSAGLGAAHPLPSVAPMRVVPIVGEHDGGHCIPGEQTWSELRAVQRGSLLIIRPVTRR